MNYYNEFNPKAAEWLRSLISYGLIPDGWVDERSISDVKASELREFKQHHFFCGIGGWVQALKLSSLEGVPGIISGFPPCQPFSKAGGRKGKEDDRHLWPTFFNIIKELRPQLVVGEQVEAAIKHGWLDEVQDDLEGEDYYSGAVVLPACSVGSPQTRSRLFWFGLANPSSERPQRRIHWWKDSGREVDNSNIGCGDTVGGVWDNTGWVHCKDGKKRPTQSLLCGMVDGIPEGVDRLLQPLSESKIRNWKHLIEGYGNAIVPQLGAEFLEALKELTKEVLND